jgi:hypothetical protein
LTLGRAEQARLREQSLHNNIKSFYVALVDAVQQVTLELHRERCNSRVNALTLFGEIQDGTPAVTIGKLTIEPAALDEFAHGPGDSDFVHQRSIGHSDCRQTRESRENGDDAPFGYRRTEALVLDTRNCSADGV